MAASVVWRFSRSFRRFSTILSEVKTENSVDQPLCSRMKQHLPLSVEEWDEIRQNSINSNEVNELNFNFRVMGLCINEKNFITADSFMKYLRKNDTKITAPILARFLRICGDNFVYSGEDLILKTYIQLKEVTPMVDSTLLEHVICGLSRTKSWKDCLQLLNDVKIVTKPGNLCYNLIAAAAFKNGDIDVGLGLLEDMDEINLPPSSTVLRNWLESCGRHDEHGRLNEVLDYLGGIRYSLPVEIAEDVKYMLINRHSDKWNGDFVEIPESGICPQCLQSLKKVEVSYEEKDVIKNAVVNHPNFLKTSSGMMDNFKEFLTKIESYDVIVDGWNIALSAKKFDPSVMAKQLHSVIHQLVEIEKKRILMINLKEMSTWPRYFKSYIQRNTSCYLTRSQRQNDALFFYALLCNDANTCDSVIISRDFMSEKIFHFEEKCLNTILQKVKWKYQVKFDLTRNGDVYLKSPMNFHPYFQKTDDFIHIPCTEKKGPSLIIHDFPQKWLCLTRETLQNKNNSLLTS